MRNEPVSSFTHRGVNVNIYQDSDCESPDSWGNTDCFLVGFDDRHFYVKGPYVKGLGVSSPKIEQPDDIRGWSRYYHVFRLTAYIHSGVALSLDNSAYPFNDRWDSGAVGYVLVRRLHCWKSKEQARKAAESLVEEWNQYLSGDVYGYVATCDEDTDTEQEDSCGGMYGLAYCEQEAREAADTMADKRAFLSQKNPGNVVAASHTVGR